MINITECPRDAMQGIHEFIPTEKKVAYLNQLLKVGFEKIDFGSFVSPKAIPQMRDTGDVLKQLELTSTKTRLLAIIANARGAAEAAAFDEIAFLGYPFSISETFQVRNTNSTIAESVKRVEEIQEICHKHNKQLLVYISMAFGNPYGDEWNPEIAIKWSHHLEQAGIRHLALADTTGSSDPDSITTLFKALLPALPGVKLGAHLHSTPAQGKEKIKAAYDAGCRNFDVAIHGFGGCPMAADDLTGNIATEELESFAENNRIHLGLDKEELLRSYTHSWEIFNRYH